MIQKDEHEPPSKIAARQAVERARKLRNLESGPYKIVRSGNDIALANFYYIPRIRQFARPSVSYRRKASAYGGVE